MPPLSKTHFFGENVAEGVEGLICRDSPTKLSIFWMRTRSSLLLSNMRNENLIIGFRDFRMIQEIQAILPT